MAEEFEVGGGNWWESSRSGSSSSSALHQNNDVSLESSSSSNSSFIGGWPTQPIPCWNNNPSLFSSNANPSFQQDCSSYDYDKQMNRLSLDQPTPPESSPPINFSSYDISQNYGMKPTGAVVGDVASPTWSKFPQFLRPKLQPQFSNNTTFWNAAMNNDDAQFSLFPVDEKPKNILGARDSSTAAKKTAGSTETSSKRARDQNDTPTSMPAFKVRKEKMGDRITALQQLISPFGKTDTASVLSEAIEYIKFLHDQVDVLSTPYMKTGASMRHQLNFEKSKNPEIASGQDLRSRGLCLVPISSTAFPVTPTFGGCFR